MCLCETFINCNVADDEISIHDYSVVLIKIKIDMGAVFSFMSKMVSSIHNITNLDTHVENVFINIEHNNDSLAVGVMYRPPSANVVFYQHVGSTRSNLIK